MCFVCFRFGLPYNKQQHVVLFSIHSRRSNRKISQYLDVNLRTAQKIQKEFDESKGDFEGRTVARIVLGKTIYPSHINFTSLFVYI